MRRLVVDLDDTICHAIKGDYENAQPDFEFIEKLVEYKMSGFDIVIHTSRNVRTFEGNIGKISAHTLPIIVEWLRKHEVPYDEIYVGKPWCGNEGFYVDDRAIRPAEFLANTHEQIMKLLGVKYDFDCVRRLR